MEEASALAAACLFGHTEVAELLVYHGAAPSSVPNVSSVQLATRIVFLPVYALCSLVRRNHIRSKLHINCLV